MRVYRFYNKAAGRYLSRQDRTLILEEEPTSWLLQSSGTGGFYVYAYGSDLMLDIHNAWVTEGNNVKLWEKTGYDVQIWTVEKNPNGTCSILYSADKRYCLGFREGKAVLQLRRDNAPGQQWLAENISDTLTREYFSCTGKGGVVELQMPLDIYRVVSPARLQLMADRLEIAYDWFGELTGWKPFRDVIVEAYKPGPYFGWVYPGSNIIHFNVDYLYEDLAKLQTRPEDWNFCTLHEMGHMFDYDKPWNFEPELMTDLKVAYVLEKTGGCAELANVGKGVFYYGTDIVQSYRGLGEDFSDTYEIFGCVTRFLDIKAKVGWTPFWQTFHYLQEQSQAYAGISRQEKLELFAHCLSHYSGEDVRAWFTPAEWNAILQQAK